MKKVTKNYLDLTLKLSVKIADRLRGLKYFCQSYVDDRTLHRPLEKEKRENKKNTYHLILSRTGSF